jgi:prophage regulatory protein
MQLETIIRPSDMKAHTGQAISSVYADAKNGLLPPPVKLAGRRASGWISREIAAVQQARIQGKTEDEIKQLVRELVAQRTGEHPQ